MLFFHVHLNANFLFNDISILGSGVQAGRLGIPAELWRLVDAVKRGGGLNTPERAAELFPPVEIAMPSDIPLDEQTAAILRYHSAVGCVAGQRASTGEAFASERLSLPCTGNEYHGSYRGTHHPRLLPSAFANKQADMLTSCRSAPVCLMVLSGSCLEYNRCLDAGSEFPPSIPLPALVSAMMAFLSALPESLIPVAALMAVESELAAHRSSGGGGGSGAGGSAGGAWGDKFLRVLSPAQHNTFLYVA